MGSDDRKDFFGAFLNTFTKLGLMSLKSENKMHLDFRDAVCEQFAKRS